MRRGFGARLVQIDITVIDPAMVGTTAITGENSHLRSDPRGRLANEKMFRVTKRSKGITIFGSMSADLVVGFRVIWINEPKNRAAGRKSFVQALEFGRVS